MPAPRLVFAFAIAAMSAAACSRNTTETIAANDPGFDVPPSTTVEVYETGGIAGFVSDWIVEKENGAFVFTRRRACSGAPCPPAVDSAKGTLSRAAADSLFAAVARDTAGLHAADFGATENGADMISYVLRVRENGTVSIDARADDGTMPPPMRRIVEVVHAAISAARK